MRTTIDLPDDVLETARSIARGRKQSLGAVIADVFRAGMAVPVEAQPLKISLITGLPVISLGRVTTLEDVKSLDDEE